MLEVLVGEGPLDTALELLVAYIDRILTFKAVTLSKISGLMAASLKIQHVNLFYPDPGRYDEQGRENYVALGSVRSCG